MMEEDTNIEFMPLVKMSEVIDRPFMLMCSFKRLENGTVVLRSHYPIVIEKDWKIDRVRIRRKGDRK